MFVLLIGLPGPRPLGPPRASFPPIKCSPCGSISRQPTRALTPPEEVEDRGPSRTDLRARGLLLSSRLVSRLSPWLSCLLSVAGARQGLTFAPNVRNIVRLCAVLTRQRACPWLVSRLYASQHIVARSDWTSLLEIIDDVSGETRVYRVAPQRWLVIIGEGIAFNDVYSCESWESLRITPAG